MCLAAQRKCAFEAQRCLIGLRCLPIRVRGVGIIRSSQMFGAQRFIAACEPARRARMQFLSLRFQHRLVDRIAKQCVSKLQIAAIESQQACIDEVYRRIGCFVQQCLQRIDRQSMTQRCGGAQRTKVQCVQPIRSRDH